MLKKTQNIPLTVLMTVYNGEKYLAEAIESILNQTYKDFEFLIINDGSNDDSDLIIRNYIKKDNRIRYIPISHVGRCQALNLGLKEAHYDWIALQDCDDISLPERIEKQMETIANNNKIKALGSYGYYINSQNKIIGEVKIGPKSEEEYYNLLKNNKNIFLLNTSLIMNKNLVLKLGGYRSSPLEDFDLLTRIGDTKELILTIPEFVVLWRRMFGSLTSQDVLNHQLRMRWIKYNMIERRKGNKELTLEEYKALKRSDPVMNRLNTKRKDYGAYFYKYFAINFAHKKYIKGITYMIFALVADPKYLFGRLISQRGDRILKVLGIS